jgi:hypothetical protein
MTTLLDALRQTSQVDCDTLDANGTPQLSSPVLKPITDIVAVAHQLGPFVDCTSNQVRNFFTPIPNTRVDNSGNRILRDLKATRWRASVTSRRLDQRSYSRSSRRDEGTARICNL